MLETISRFINIRTKITRIIRARTRRAGKYIFLVTKLPNISFMIERVLLIVKIPTDHNGIGFGTLGVMVSEIFEVLYPKK